ncbi:MAG: helix-turn-helix transcriptional regulator [Bacteroidales bacterium]|nr:helix-turn-helix transcriptional regulator [Bacteroidales bacterium]
MVLTLYLFLPVAVCLFWVLVHCLVASKTDTFHVFVPLFLACGLYIFAEACHSLTDHGSTLFVITTLIGMLAGPSIVPLLITYLHYLMHFAKNNNPVRHIWVIIPTALFSGGLLLFIIGFEAVSGDAVHKMFHLVTEDIYRAILAAELVYLLMFVIMTLRQKRLIPGSIFSFLFRGKRIGLSRLQLGVGMIPMVVMASRIGFGENLYGQGTLIAVISATLLLFSAFFFGFNALFGNQPIISMEDFRYLLRFNYNKDNKAETVESMMNDLLDDAEEEALKRIQEKIGENLHIDAWRSGETSDKTPVLANKIFSAVSKSWDEDSLASRFQHLMMDQHLFLQPKLSLDDVAESLNTNKTYVSKMVNNTYNLGFPELINILRVDYAEQYIISHREARQEEIAQECGFLSASSFNTTFKKVTGMTPKVWIASIDRQAKEAKEK